MIKVVTALLFTAFCQVVTAQEVKIEITGNDQKQFNIKEFEVTEGQIIVLSFKHIGQLPTSAMSLNVVILKPGTAIPAFSVKCAVAKDNQFIPKDNDYKQQIVAHTKMLGGGESDEIRFTAPKPGSYPFICSFPSHYATMQGVMTVKAK